jgi:formate dehydrogenase iron-sulfur subunit
MPKGVLVDLTRCIGCRGCQVACKEWNERSVKKTVMYGNFTNPPKLNSECYTHIRFYEADAGDGPVWHFAKDQCLHCREPACASACPVGALRKSQAGPVIYDFSRCIGCRYCMLACPFEIPKYEWESTWPWIQKCSFCSERIRDGMTPACIQTCPTGTMYYDDYDKVVAEAKQRLSVHAGRYVNHIYGLEEAGGTSWIYLSPVSFEKIGFARISNMALPKLSWASLSHIPFSVTGVAALLAGIAWFRNRGSKDE